MNFTRTGKEDGSLDWTWTSDIRINSPPFYRLNYEGIVAPPAGLEPATYGLTVRRSTDWTKEELLSDVGSLDWTWTSDIRINSPPFYRLNYEGIVTSGRGACYWLVWSLSTKETGKNGSSGSIAELMNSFKQVYFYQQQANTSSGKGSRRLPTESVDNPVCYFLISCAKPRGSRRTKNKRKFIAKLKCN